MRDRLLEVILCLGLAWTSAMPVSAQTTLPIWPLCGRIQEAMATPWQEGVACPNLDPLQTDFPIRYGFGHRNFINSNSPVDYHRGIDIYPQADLDGDGEPDEHPVFAVLDGYITVLDRNGQDGTLQILHPQQNPSHVCSSTNPCLITRYRHVGGILDDLDACHPSGPLNSDCQVVQGQHIAWTGVSINDQAHLHFEVRDPHQRATEAGMSTTSWDRQGKTSWSKDARNPLFYLHYDQASNYQPFSIDWEKDTQTVNPLGNPIYWVTLSANGQYRFNLKSITVQGYYQSSTQQPVEVVWADQSSHAGSLVSLYEINTTHLDLDAYSVMHSPFSSGLRWNTERTENPHFVTYIPSGTPESPDQLLTMLPTVTSLSKAYRYNDFDDKLMTVSSTDPNATDGSWYELKVGFYNLEPVGLPELDLCYAITVQTYSPEDGSREQRYVEGENPAQNCSWLP